jgi:cellulose biosynthesis protein BcsQ
VNRMSGTIITFYSYKGGTGRTMVLTNVAWIMASNGHKVLLVDWDLESPGLHRYLRPFIRDPELAKTLGLIDWVQGQNARFRDLQPHILSLDCNFRNDGSISFLPAGRQDDDYAQRVSNFDRLEFNHGARGAEVVAELWNGFRASGYDYVLIDGRAGVSDVSRICTVQTPDVLVLPFTLNHQNIKGTELVASRVRDKYGDTIRIFPVPTRIEEGEREKLKTAAEYAQKRFARFLSHAQPDRKGEDADRQARYWQDVETPYVPFYAFEEMPAALRDESGSQRGLLAPSERLVSRIVERTMKLHSENEEWRKAPAARYAFDPNEAVGGVLPQGPSWPVRVARSIARWLRHRWWSLRSRRWQLATSALTGVILVYGIFVLLDIRPRLQSVTADLQEVDKLASEHGSSGNFPKAKLGTALQKLQAINKYYLN